MADECPCNNADSVKASKSSTWTLGSRWIRHRVCYTSTAGREPTPLTPLSTQRGSSGRARNDGPCAKPDRMADAAVWIRDVRSLRQLQRAAGGPSLRQTSGIVQGSVTDDLAARRRAHAAVSGAVSALDDGQLAETVLASP